MKLKILTLSGLTRFEIGLQFCPFFPMKVFFFYTAKFKKIFKDLNKTTWTMSWHEEYLLQMLPDCLSLLKWKHYSLKFSDFVFFQKISSTVFDLFDRCLCLKMPQMVCNLVTQQVCRSCGYLTHKLISLCWRMKPLSFLIPWKILNQNFLVYPLTKIEAFPFSREVMKKIEYFIHPNMIVSYFMQNLQMIHSYYYFPTYSD